jgi:dTDP-4-dehydrorhamnose reductase
MDVTETVLIFGRNGQVAQELAHLQQTSDLTLQFAGRERCDLMTTDPKGLIEAVQPIGVINASAYTAVDRAETEPDAAYRLNRDAVGEMARACAAADIPFVHISTDYVFDGTKAEPYVETDLRNPLSVYGASKASGEDAVEAAGGSWTIFRTAWVFSPFGANFIKTMRRFATERPDMAVVADQHGRPTLAKDIAVLCQSAVTRSINGDASLQGLYHLAGADDAVWADIAERVFEERERCIGKRPVLNRILTADFPTAAKRPGNSRLETAKLQHSIGWSPRPWRETVDICLAALAAT